MFPSATAGRLLVAHIDLGDHTYYGDPTVATLPRLSLPTLSDMAVEAHEVEPEFLRTGSEIGGNDCLRRRTIREPKHLGQLGNRSRATGTSILAEV